MKPMNTFAGAAAAFMLALSLAAGAAYADAADDGQAAMDTAGDESRPIQERAQGWSDAQEAAGRILDEAFGDSDDSEDSDNSEDSEDSEDDN